MTRERAQERLRKLLALAGPGSGAPEGEARNAAVAAVRLMIEHGLAPGAGRGLAIDIEHVTALSLRLLELEHLLAQEHDDHARQTCEANRLALRVLQLEKLVAQNEDERASSLAKRDQHWALVVDRVRREEQRAARTRTKSARQGAAIKAREDLARSGGEARHRKLDPERKSEIGRAGAVARWARWRERREAGAVTAAATARSP